MGEARDAGQKNIGAASRATHLVASALWSRLLMGYARQVPYFLHRLCRASPILRSSFVFRRMGEARDAVQKINGLNRA
ncbi:hypothetical protein ELS24_12380 [Achromobacter spanius]|uniref:hypothetical protein n=1 Tax=Achromobacter spanius TaxID=217203 RepID=UPI000F8FA1E9|nr:hypothetical protein [Achromobacter spanius]AZS79172.1 hypothetical protein ELS24_12380 [Achromobacter spanius]